MVPSSGSSRSRKQNDGDRSQETRSQFEERMKKELQDLFNSRMAELLKGQMEATRMTVEAAEKLANMRDQSDHHHSTSHSHHHRHTSRSSKRESSKSNNVASSIVQTKKSSSSVPEDVVTMISKAESNIPELLSAVEATDRSRKEIQKSLQSAIKELSVADDTSRTSNITEEIAAELTDDDISKKSMGSVSDEDYGRSSSWSNGRIFVQNLEIQGVNNKNQYLMIKKREKALNEKVNQSLAKIKVKKEEASKDHNDQKYQKLCQKEKSIRRKFKDQKEELSNLRYTLQVAERERKLLLEQHHKMSKKSRPTSSSAALTPMTTTTDEDEVSTASQISEELSHQDSSIVTKSEPKRSSKIDTFKKQLGAAALKTPLSPKRNVSLKSRNRKRHSSAESEDSQSVFSQSEVVSSAGDQSDLEIRINALQDELEKRMKTAEKLKKEQKLAKRERLKFQEDTLKKRIEAYDQLITKTKAEIEAAASPTSSSSSSVKVQPQIKSPKQQSNYEPPASPTPSISSYIQEAENTSQNNSISLDESNSTDTIIASPQKPATPSAPEEEGPPVWPLVPSAEPPSDVGTCNNNYSDDFTSSISVASNQPDIAPIEEEAVTTSETPKIPKYSEKTVDSICGHLLEGLIEDAISHVKKAPKKKVKIEKPVSPTRRPQDLMTTTFDVSSESSEEGMS